MNRYRSRKFIMSLVGIASATGAAYSDIPPDTQSSFFGFIAQVLTFYLVGQSAVDASGKLKGFKE